MADELAASLVTYTGFTGINNILPAERIGPEAFTAAINVDIDDTKRVTRRRGAVLRVNPGATHSLFAANGLCLFRAADALYQLLPDMSTKLLASGYQVGRPMFYTEHPVGIFFMDGLARGFFNGQLSGWGTDPPILQPTAASVGAGQLAAGTYQFALTFVRDDGSESGTRRAGVVTATGAIAFSNIEVSADPNVVQKQIYVSSPDGETLYLSLILPPAATTATFSGGIIGATLETMFKTPPPNGQVLAEHNGRILVGFGRYIAYSSAFRPERFDIARQAIPCEDTVRIIAPVQTGVFVGTDSAIFYLDGADIDAASTTALADYGAVPGSLVYVDGDLVGASGRCALFLTAQGVVLCTPGGNFKNLTRDRYWPAASQRAGALFIREAGRSRYLASLMSS